MNRLSGLINTGLVKGPGGIATQDIKDLGKDVAGSLINKIPGLSGENKEALNKIKDQLADKISTPSGQTLQSLISKPSAVSPTMKPEVPSPSQKPEGWFKFGGISGWDKFKNTMGKVGEKLGLKTHEITDDDYVFNPKKKKWEFDWKVARENDAKRGRATKTEFDPTTLIGIGSKIASKGIL